MIHYQDSTVAVHHGDCLDVMRGLPDASVDSIVTDPPYDLTSGKKGGTGSASLNLNSPAGRSRISTGGGFMGAEWDSTGIAFRPEVWVECLRVLKPGGHMLAFGGSRTWHRLAVAVDDAGFEIRDSIAWLYGQGFPKSRNVGREVPAFEGWGTALKPAFEPIVVGRKPIRGTVAANVLLWGCGAINISGCRVHPDSSSSEVRGSEAGTRGCPVHGLSGLRNADAKGQVFGGAGKTPGDLFAEVPQRDDVSAAQPPLQRWSLDRGALGLQEDGDGSYVAGGSSLTFVSPSARGVRAPHGDGPEGGPTAPADRDGASHQRSEGGQSTGKPAPDGLGRPLAGAPSDRAGDAEPAGREHPPSDCTCGGAGGLGVETDAGRWPTNVVLDNSQAELLDKQNGSTFSRIGKPRGADHGNGWGMTTTGAEYDDQGGPSRFFPTFRYQAKAPSSERPRHGEVAHPTVKPLNLMRWLVRIVTPPGGVCLDPFAGSGTTAEACILEGFRCIAVEREETYLPLILARVQRQQLADLL